MTIEQLKKKIKTKFRTVSRFCKIANVDRQEIQKFFQSARNKMTPEKEERIKYYYNLVVENSNGQDQADLTVSIRKRIKMAIRSRGGVNQFVDENPEFNVNSIYQIINGNRKTINNTVKQLMTKLEIR